MHILIFSLNLMLVVRIYSIFIVFGIMINLSPKLLLANHLTKKVSFKSGNNKNVSNTFK